MNKTSMTKHSFYTDMHPVIQLIGAVTHSHTVRVLARACAGPWMELSLSTGTGLNSREDRMAPIQQHSSLAPQYPTLAFLPYRMPPASLCITKHYTITKAISLLRLQS